MGEGEQDEEDEEEDKDEESLTLGGGGDLGIRASFAEPADRRRQRGRRTRGRALGGSIQHDELNEKEGREGEGRGGYHDAVEDEGRGSRRAVSYYDLCSLVELDEDEVSRIGDVLRSHASLMRGADEGYDVRVSSTFRLYDTSDSGEMPSRSFLAGVSALRLPLNDIEALLVARHFATASVRLRARGGDPRSEQGMRHRRERWERLRDSDGGFMALKRRTRRGRGSRSRSIRGRRRTSGRRVRSDLESDRRRHDGSVDEYGGRDERGSRNRRSRGRGKDASGDSDTSRDRDRDRDRERGRKWDGDGESNSDSEEEEDEAGGEMRASSALARRPGHPLRSREQDSEGTELTLGFPVAWTRFVAFMQQPPLALAAGTTGLAAGWGSDPLLRGSQAPGFDPRGRRMGMG